MADKFLTQSKPRPVCAERQIALSTGAQTLTDVADAVYCLTAGTVTITDGGGTAVAYPCAAGQVINFRAATFSVASGTFAAWYL